MKVVECGDGELLPAPRLIEILDSHDEAGITRPCGSQRERAGVAHVEEARGGGSEPSASGRGVGHGRVTLGRPTQAAGAVLGRPPGLGRSAAFRFGAGFGLTTTIGASFA